jgi:hypothetical protein
MQQPRAVVIGQVRTSDIDHDLTERELHAHLHASSTANARAMPRS